jgi:hypothetical protein
MISDLGFTDIGRTETFSTGNRHSVQTKSEAGTFADVMAETELL